MMTFQVASRPQTAARVVRGENGKTGADLAARGAISGLGFAIDNGWNTPAAVLPWVVGATGVVASVLVDSE